MSENSNSYINAVTDPQTRKALHHLLDRILGPDVEKYPSYIDQPFTTAITVAADGTTAFEVTSAFTGTTGFLFGGTATNAVSITGACTTPISITGAFTTGINIAADGTTAIAVTSAFSGTTGISLAGTGSTAGINISGNHTTGITIGAQTTAGLAVTGNTVDGIRIDRATYTNSAMQIGAFAASLASGSGIVFSSTCTTALRVYGESTEDLTSAYNFRSVLGRNLVSCVADTVINQETYGVTGQVVVKNGSMNHYHSGVLGTFESGTLCHIQTDYGCAAVMGRVGATNTTVESGGLLAGVMAVQNTATWTVTGTAAGFATKKTAAGVAWPIGLYMAAGDVTKGIDITCSAIGATGRIASLKGTMAAGNLTDGYGAVEIDLTSSGTVAGTIAASSTWLNFAAGSVPGANIICCQNNGIYLPTGITASSAKMIMGMRMQYVADDGANPGELFCFSTNIYSNALTAVFDVNAIADLGGSTGAQTGNDYKVPLFKDATAGQLWYVNVYHT